MSFPNIPHWLPDALVIAFIALGAWVVLA